MLDKLHKVFAIGVSLLILLAFLNWFLFNTYIKTYTELTDTQLEQLEQLIDFPFPEDIVIEECTYTEGRDRWLEIHVRYSHDKFREYVNSLRNNNIEETHYGYKVLSSSLEIKLTDETDDKITLITYDESLDYQSFLEAE